MLSQINSGERHDNGNCEGENQDNLVSKTETGERGNGEYIHGVIGRKRKTISTIGHVSQYLKSVAGTCAPDQRFYQMMDQSVINDDHQNQGKDKCQPTIFEHHHNSQSANNLRNHEVLLVGHEFHERTERSWLQVTGNPRECGNVEIEQKNQVSLNIKEVNRSQMQPSATVAFAE